MKKLVLMFTIVIGAFALIGCGGTSTTTNAATTTTAAPTTTTEKPKIDVQGVTDTTIYVGNTAATSGAYAAVGIPFNDAMEAVFKMVNDAGGIDGRKIEFIHYDDGFDAATGLTNTKKLIEEDKVFALVGHFGTPTVGATLNLIHEVGIPMVYAATGINGLYAEQSLGDPVMPVQPIYRTDGRILAARAIYEHLYGTDGMQALPTDGKIGVIYTNDDAGNSMLEGIQAEAQIADMEDQFIYQAVTAGSFNTAVTILKASGVSAVILAMNQEPFGYAMTSMSNLSLNVPVFTSYVNANVTYVDQNRYSEDRPIYANAWLDLTSTEGAADYAAYAACINQADLSTDLKTNYLGNSFAIAGYVAATVFVEGLKRVAANGDDLTWANYIAAMEETPISIPMGGVVDFSGGKRWGVAEMSLLEYQIVQGDNPYTTTVETSYPAFIKVRDIESIQTIEGK